MTYGTSKVIYMYPLTPTKTPDVWKTFTNPQQMLDACQIPQPVLDSMSTKALTMSVLDYPLFGNIYAFNYLLQGFSSVAGSFNGLVEVTRRKDGGSTLMSIYWSTNAAAFGANWSSIQKVGYAKKVSNIELILGKRSILSQLNEQQLKVLANKIYVNRQTKQQFANFYGRTGIDISEWVMGKIMLRAGYQPFKQEVDSDYYLREFIDRLPVAHAAVTQKIIPNVEVYLSNY